MKVIEKLKSVLLAINEGYVSEWQNFWVFYQISMIL
jgi:hypothetical protein